MFDLHTRFYEAVASSAANAEYCERVYGRNLCQHGFADLVLPDGTELAQAWQRLGLAYRTWDYTEQMLAHLRRRRLILEALKGQFEAEGNRFPYDSHLGEANGIERAYVNGAGRCFQNFAAA